VFATFGKRNARSAAEEVEKKAKVESENILIDQCVAGLLARQRARTDESLQALQRLGLEGPTVEARCTCEAKCHCIYGSTGRAGETAAAVTARPGMAGLPPTNDGEFDASRDILSKARLDLGWLDKKHSSRAKMPEGKRDSIRPDENASPSIPENASLRSSPEAGGWEDVSASSRPESSSPSGAKRVKTTEIWRR
jgi:hypothetical protein